MPSYATPHPLPARTKADSARPSGMHAQAQLNSARHGSSIRTSREASLRSSAEHADIRASRDVPLSSSSARGGVRTSSEITSCSDAQQTDACTHQDVSVRSNGSITEVQEAGHVLVQLREAQHAAASAEGALVHAIVEAALAKAAAAVQVWALRDSILMLCRRPWHSLVLVHP